MGMDTFILLIGYGAELIVLNIIGTAIYLNSKQRHYKLQKTKQFIQKNIHNSKIEKTIYAKLSSEEKEKILIISNKLKKQRWQLNNFFKILLQNTDEKNLRHFSNNIQTLKIYRKPTNILTMLVQNKNTAAEYIQSKNCIIMYINSDNALYHELLHMSSSSEKRASPGFHRILHSRNINIYPGLDITYNEIGRGINEGYTELLNNRLFKNRSTSYIRLQKIAHLIELFFQDKKEMENYYYNDNIEGIIYELNKYMSLEEIIELLIDIDEIYYQNPINLAKYFEVKRRLLKIYQKYKSEEETSKFKKEYKENHFIKILKRQV